MFFKMVINSATLFADLFLHSYEATIDTLKTVSYFDLQIDSKGELLNKVHHKHDFSFSIINCPFICDNILHLRMECSYHNSYTMPDLAVATLIFLPR